MSGVGILLMVFTVVLWADGCVKRYIAAYKERTEHWTEMHRK